jgi:hypothetical protein
MLLLPLMQACSSGDYYKISQKAYRLKVQTLGVLPLLVDEDSAIVHPDGEELVNVLRCHNAAKEVRLIEILKGGKDYFDVRPVAGNPQQLFGRLVSTDSLCGEGSALYRSYYFNAAAVAELTERNVVDALLVIILNGVVRPEKRWDRMHLSYLEADYNMILATAFVVLPSGEVVWEYPGQPGEAFLELQYPAFDEAYYNKTDKVKIRHITLAGLERVLAETDRDFLGRTAFPRPYQEVFERIDSALKPGLLPLKSKKGKSL